MNLHLRRTSFDLIWGFEQTIIKIECHPCQNILPHMYLSTIGSTGSSYLNNSRIKWTVIIGFIWFGFFIIIIVLNQWTELRLGGYRWSFFFFVVSFQPPDTIKANTSQEPLSVVSGFLDHALVSVASTVWCFCIVLYTTIINRAYFMLNDIYTFDICMYSYITRERITLARWFE